MMGKEEMSQNERRTTRSSSAATTPDSKAPALVSKTSNKSKALSINSLGFSNESLSLDELLNLYPGRRKQVLDLLNLIGPLNSPMFPLFVYGSASTGKTDVILNIFKHLRRPFVYCSCITSYSSRTMFESVLNQLLLHRKSETNGYLSAKRCEKMSDFVNLMREALSSVVDSLKGSSEKSGGKNSPSSLMNGTMVYLIFDDIERVRDWEKGANSLAVLFSLHHLLKMREVGFIFISRKSQDTFESDTGYEDPLPVHFPDYSEDDLRQILMRNQASPKLYSSFLDVVLRPFCRVTRRVDELCAAFSPLFEKYCEPLGNLPGEDKRKLYTHVQPYITLFLNETSNPRPLVKPSPNKDSDTMKNYITNKKQGSTGNIDEVDFHMSTSAKYLLISAFLASRNPATLDASLFDSTGGSDNRKRKRKSSEKSMEKKETKEQELLMKGPGTFPLERLLAVFQCITSVSDYWPDGEEQGNKEDDCNLGSENLMSNILLQLSSLCSANFITRGGSCCPLEGSVRYRSTVSEDIALKVARSLKFPLSKYMYR